MLYKDNLKTHKIAIAKVFGLPSDVFESWLHSLTVLRNACAHHARIWNRHFAIQPKTHKFYVPHFAHPPLFYTLAVIIRLLMKEMDASSDFHTRLKALVAAHLGVNKTAMGFPMGWDTDPLWG